MTTNERPNCHLYSLEPIERVRNELIDLGVDPDANTTINFDLPSRVDGMRYENEKGVFIFRDALKHSFGENTKIHVLDVGAGFGGPARSLAAKGSNIHILALELIPEISRLGKSLSQRFPNVKDRIFHVEGNVQSLETALSKYNIDEPKEKKFHAAQAVLTLCHVPNLLLSLSNICRQLLDTQGILYIEDFWFQNVAAVTEKDRHILQSSVGCPRLPPTRKEWIDVLQQAGFTAIDFQDTTEEWKAWVHERAMAYENAMERNIRVHGVKGANHMLEFYQAMDGLFCDANLRGCRIVAHKRQSRQPQPQ